MSTSPQAAPRTLVAYGIGSVVAGSVGIALVMWGQLVGAVPTYDGHSFDRRSTAGLLPGFTCAGLAIVLALLGAGDRSTRTALTRTGAVLGIIAILGLVTGMPGLLFPNPTVHPEQP